MTLEKLTSSQATPAAEAEIEHQTSHQVIAWLLVQSSPHSSTEQVFRRWPFYVPELLLKSRQDIRHWRRRSLDCCLS